MITMKFYTIIPWTQELEHAYKNWGYLAQFLNQRIYSPHVKTEPEPHIFNLKAYTKLKITDFMPFATGTIQGLLFNDKIKEILENCNIPSEYALFDISIEHKKETYKNYNWLATVVLPENPSPLDFKKTKFCINFNYETNRFGALASFENYQEAANANAHLRSQAELWLTKAAWQYDIIILPRIGIGEHNIIISEKLANAFFENKVTGIEIIKADWIHAIED